MLSVEDAMQFLLAAARPVIDMEEIPADEALGRVLAAPLTATVSVPPPPR